ncbi:MAG TPA: glycosyltransferase, partial [Patescibacteria group bacterium]|nr:glycosyltransferase [Patescibacteria group bacterium]
MVSIIIVNYHVKKELLACIASIFASKPKTKCEVIVVDNDEIKKSKTDIKEQFPQIRYVPNENKGFGQGNNVGASVAKGEFLFFLNPDTTIEKGTIDTLVSYLNNHTKVAIAAPLLLNMDRTIVPLQGARTLTPFRAMFSFSFISKFFPKNPVAKKYWYVDEWNKQSVKEVESIPGTAFMIRRSLYEKIRGFDEKFFLYFEEHDLCKRILDLGWKIIMHPKAKVLHFLGKSTTQSKKNINSIFQRSRWYYLKKHFGFMQAVLAESVLRTGKYTALVTMFLGIGAFLRVIILDSTMPFIGDQGWYYLSARDMVLTGEIPLVGIPSSHPWLHQGALWTYLLGGWFLLFGFHPVNGAYLSVALDVLATFFLYKFGSAFFSRRAGLISAAFYATSPLVIANARMPYHTSPIPLFTIFALYCFYKWISGNSYFFPLLIFLLAVLYNFELATFLLSMVVGLVLIYGLLKKKQWARQLINKKIIILSITGWIIGMLPMLFYDVTHGFPQTLVFLAWIGYKALTTVGIISSQVVSSGSFPSLLSFSAEHYTHLMYPFSNVIVLILFLSTCLFLFFQRKKRNILMLLFINFFLIAGFFVAKTPSAAYLPLLYPGLIICTALLFNWGIMQDRLKAFSLTFLALIIFFNCWYV